MGQAVRFYNDSLTSREFWLMNRSTWKKKAPNEGALCVSSFYVRRAGVDYRVVSARARRGSVGRS